ncbi:hypothetical protein SASPL_153239 [Salvia splendens]|uniref:Magnesium transporter n=1 Tax=Salvia splendens TaxID=180675 RepID=A0A8X8W4G4_SALSN|nr:hypothetical protein SASPL_153239 [Salvia splendens]
MWESICLTIAATAGNNIGKVLQKKGTLILPPLSFKLKPLILKELVKTCVVALAVLIEKNLVIRAYASNSAWIIGFLMDIFGAILMLLALSQAPVSVIQPVSGCGLAILSVFSHFYLKEIMNAIDWIGIALAGIGTIGVGAGGEEQKAPSISIIYLPWLVFLVALVFVDAIRSGRGDHLWLGVRHSIWDCICDIKDGIPVLGARIFEVVASRLCLNQHNVQCLRIRLPDTWFEARKGNRRVHLCSRCLDRDWGACRHVCSWRTAAFGPNVSPDASPRMALHHSRSDLAGIFIEADATPPKDLETLCTKRGREELRPEAVELDPWKGHESEHRDPSEHAAPFDTAPCKSESLSLSYFYSTLDMIQFSHICGALFRKKRPPPVGTDDDDFFHDIISDINFFPDDDDDEDDEKPCTPDSLHHHSPEASPPGAGDGNHHASAADNHPMRTFSCDRNMAHLQHHRSNSSVAKLVSSMSLRVMSTGAAATEKLGIRYFKHQEDSVWKKTIILGERCRVPRDDDDDNLKLYDEKGHKIITYHPKSHSGLIQYSRQSTSSIDSDKDEDLQRNL